MSTRARDGDAPGTKSQNTRAPAPRLSLFAPPYRDFLPIDPEESFPGDLRILRGTALIWSLADGAGGDAVLHRVAERPAGMPLMVVLPPARGLERVRDQVLAITEEARPQTVLPYHPHLVAEEMAALLRREPESLPDEFLDYLTWRGVPLDQETRWLVRRTVELSAELRTLAALARGVYVSRRALGRRFRRRGLPVPSHWLQFSRLLRGTIRLQNSRATLLEVACSLGYPDGFTMSNQMDRLVGVRPSEARERLGWEWFVEAWLQTERERGGLEAELKAQARAREDGAPGFPESHSGTPGFLESHSAPPRVRERIRLGGASEESASGEGGSTESYDTTEGLAAGEGGAPDRAERSEAA